MLAKACSEVFLIRPRTVAMTTKAPSENSRTGCKATTRSPSCNGIRFTKALPLAVRPACGISQIFLRVDPPLAGEHQQGVVGRRHEELGHEVLLVGGWRR